MKITLTAVLVLFLACISSAQTHKPEKPVPLIHTDATEELLRIFEDGYEAMVEGRYDQALQTYDRGIKLAPREPSLWLNKALVLLERGMTGYNAALNLTDEELRKQKIDVAFQDFRESLKTSSRLQELDKALTPPVDAALRNAYDSHFLGSLQIHARALWVMTTKVDASYLSAAVDAFNAYFNLETDAERKLPLRFELSRMLLTNHRYHEAFAEYQKILQIDSNSVDALLGAAVTLLGLGHQTNDKTNIQDGLIFLERFIELAPEKHRLKGSAHEALTYLRQAATPANKSEKKAATSGAVIVETAPPDWPQGKRGDRDAVNGGVVNGRAIRLPRPNYPLIARFAQAVGTVVVQVIIDEDGHVSAARAVGGHPLLQAVAVAAAQQAEFSPTRLSGQPVRVSGVITYNFISPP
jgi:TonB family protein